MTVWALRRTVRALRRTVRALRMTARALSMTLSVDLVLLVALALAVRWPYLWDIPRFTDETDEALLGLQIARGQTLRLTNQDPYIGALWNYLLAAGLAVLAYADVLVENLRHNLYGLQAARDVQIEYARGEALSALVYLRRLGSLVKLLGDSLGGVLSQNDSLVGPLGDPTVLSVFLVSLVGLGPLIR